jgi:predicted nicotinamide N-methyase
MPNVSRTTRHCGTRTADPLVPDATAALIDVKHHIAVMACTRSMPTPLVPEITLLCAENAYDVWAFTADGDESAPVPFWSFPWAGGQALARYVLDNPDVVAGKTVLDLAAGSGLVAIAAALAGAAHVTANDIDPYAAAAQELNAHANGVRVTPLMVDLLDQPTDVDVVLAGDVCYERDLTDRMVAFLLRAHAGGATVLLGDPGRTYLPRELLKQVAIYDVPTTLAVEDQQLKQTTIWRPRPALRPAYNRRGFG